MILLNIENTVSLQYCLNVNNEYYLCHSKQEVLDVFLCYINKDNDTTNKRQSCIDHKRLLAMIAEDKLQYRYHN